jgi:hypothetical protein
LVTNSKAKDEDFTQRPERKSTEFTEKRKPRKACTLKGEGCATRRRDEEKMPARRYANANADANFCSGSIYLLTHGMF